ncbi:hypothetical protein CGRA01v4_13439 [Colletotrichum graminicola]|nr:hypothetical protein CGRA01v4_13439 [Colletotrichum graminicola]
MPGIKFEGQPKPRPSCTSPPFSLLVLYTQPPTFVSPSCVSLSSPQQLPTQLSPSYSVQGPLLHMIPNMSRASGH